MKYCPNCNYPNDDGNKFCRECGTKLSNLKNYCPYCDRIYTSGEKFCVECGNKLIAKSQHTIRVTPTKSPPVRDKPVSINTYNIKQDVPKEDTFGYIGRDSPTSEFENKTKEELEMELRFVTTKYDDCRKTGDYMATYYKDKKELLEHLLSKR